MTFDYSVTTTALYQPWTNAGFEIHVFAMLKWDLCSLNDLPSFYDAVKSFVPCQCQLETLEVLR